MAERTTTSFARPQQGPFSVAFYRQVLERVIDGAVFTLTVSTGDEERVFFFTRGAILFLAVGASGGEVLARKIIAKGLLPAEKVQELVLRANSGTPLLQDIVRDEGLVDAKVLASLVEETIEDHLLELMLWDGSLALFDLVPGNPPPRLYDQEVPAVRLSVGSKPLLQRALAQWDEGLRILIPLGGSMRNRVKLLPESRVTDPVVSKHVPVTPRPIGDVVAAAQKEGVPPWKTASALSRLVAEKKIGLEKVEERTKEEELAQAYRIEDAFEAFLNGLLARTHLATIYEKANEKEKAADQYRGIADEHLKRDAIDAGVAALKNVVRLLPQDLSARELMVKVLRGADRLSEAAKECVDLARCFLDQNLPGRAAGAFDLALKLVPKNLPVMWMLAGLYSWLGKKEEAIQRYEEIAEMARASGDQDAEFAAYQQVLELDPKHGKAREVVHKLSGYRDAVHRRVMAVAVAVLALLLVVAYGCYEIAALRAFMRARDQARAAVDEQQFDIARSAVQEFKNSWTFTRFKAAADELLAAIGGEEALFKGQRSIKEEREARELEAKLQLPKALELWRAAFADAEEGDRKQTLANAAASCEARVKKVADDLDQAHKLDLQDLPKQAYDLIAEDAPRAPWLFEQKDLRVPLMLDSIPKDARITIDGEVQTAPTPTIVRRPLAAFHVRLDGRNRDPLELDVSGLQPWPLVLTLPRRAIWRAHDLAASSEPLLYEDLVVVGGVDRYVSAVARDSGAFRWKAALGIFGECDAPLASMGQGILAARARSGMLFGVSSGGTVRWRLDLEPPAFDPLEPHPERPVVAPGGALVREGVRGLVLVNPEGAVSWRARASSDLVGAPAASAERVLVSGERSLLAFDAKTGKPAWRLELPGSPVLGPAVGPHGVVFVALELGALARVDEKTGRLLGCAKDVFEGAAPSAIWGDPRWTLVASQGGDVIAFDEKGKLVFRAFTDIQKPILWVRSSPYAVLFGDLSTLYVLDKQGKELWRHPVANAGPASADDRQVYQGAPDGLSSYDR